jgi:hypothetical protein
MTVNDFNSGHFPGLCKLAATVRRATDPWVERQGGERETALCGMSLSTAGTSNRREQGESA